MRIYQTFDKKSTKEVTEKKVHCEPFDGGNMTIENKVS